VRHEPFAANQDVEAQPPVHDVPVAEQAVTAPATTVYPMEAVAQVVAVAMTEHPWRIGQHELVEAAHCDPAAHIVHKTAVAAFGAAVPVVPAVQLVL